MKLIKKSSTAPLGFSADRRKRRNQHRTAAQKLLRSGGLMNWWSARGSTFAGVARWHMEKARNG
jgi:hypothetical protein